VFALPITAPNLHAGWVPSCEKGRPKTCFWANFGSQAPAWPALSQQNERDQRTALPLHLSGGAERVTRKDAAKLCLIQASRYPPDGLPMSCRCPADALPHSASPTQSVSSSCLSSMPPLHDSASCSASTKFRVGGSRVVKSSAAQKVSHVSWYDGE
jgi:hypothetical protein